VEQEVVDSPVSEKVDKKDNKEKKKRKKNNN